MSNSKLQGLVYDVLHQSHTVFLANSWAVYDGGEAKSRLHHLFGLNLDSELIKLFVECGFITIRENVPRFLLSRFNKWWINKSGKLDWSPGCREGKMKTYCLRIGQARGVNFCSLDRPLQSVQHLQAYEGFKAIFREDRTTSFSLCRSPQRNVRCQPFNNPPPIAPKQKISSAEPTILNTPSSNPPAAKRTRFFSPGKSSNFDLSSKISVDDLGKLMEASKICHQKLEDTGNTNRKPFDTLFRMLRPTMPMRDSLAASRAANLQLVNNISGDSVPLPSPLLLENQQSPSLNRPASGLNPPSVLPSGLNPPSALPSGLQTPSFTNITGQGLKRKDVPRGKTIKILETKDHGKLTLLVPKGLKPVESKGMILLIPSTDILINRTQHTLNKKYSEDGRLFLSTMMASNQFMYTGHSRRILGAAIAELSGVSLLNWAKICPTTMFAFLAHADIDVSLESIMDVTPSATSIEGIVLDLAIDSQIVIKFSIDDAGGFYASFDKADGSARCVKLISWWAKDFANIYFPDGQPMIVTLDADHTGNSTEDVILGLKHSIAKLCLAATVKGKGRTNDTGGGGGGASVDEPLRRHMILWEHALGGNCGMHDLNLLFAFPLKKVIYGTTTGVGSRNAVQCVVAAFKFLEYLGKATAQKTFNMIIEALKQMAPELDASTDDAEENGTDQSPKTILQTLASEIVSDIADLPAEIEKIEKEKIQNLQMGSETRWWSIGVAIVILLKKFDWWRALAQLHSTKCKKDNKARKCAQDFLSLSNEKTLMSDLHFLAAVHTTFMSPHLKWMQRKDKLIKKAGFSAPNMLSRCYVMHDDLKKMIRWESHEGFKAFKESLTWRFDDDDTTHRQKLALQVKKANEFIGYSYEEFKKMLYSWYDVNRNAFLGGFSEEPIARLAAQKFLGYSYCADRTKSVYVPATRKWYAPAEDTNDEAGDEMEIMSIEEHRDRLPTYQSFVHDRVIDLQGFADFLDENIPDDDAAENMRSNWHFIENREHFEKIAKGGVDLWNLGTPDVYTIPVNTNTPAPAAPLAAAINVVPATALAVATGVDDSALVPDMTNALVAENSILRFDICSDSDNDEDANEADTETAKAAQATATAIRQHFLQEYGAFCTSQQMAERAIKMTNNAAAHHRGEANTSIRALALAFLKEVSK